MKKWNFSRGLRLENKIQTAGMNKCGATVIELMLAMVLLGIGVMGAIVFFSKTVNIWNLFSNQTKVHQQARTALLEMESKIRESSGPVSGLLYPGIGATSQGLIFFNTIESGASNWMKYYQDGDKLNRVVNTTTTTLIWAGLSDVWFIHESSYVVRIDSLTLSTGSSANAGNVRLHSKIFLRNR